MSDNTSVAVASFVLPRSAQMNLPEKNISSCTIDWFDSTVGGWVDGWVEVSLDDLTPGQSRNVGCFKMWKGKAYLEPTMAPT